MRYVVLVDQWDPTGEGADPVPFGPFASREKADRFAERVNARVDAASAVGSAEDRAYMPFGRASVRFVRPPLVMQALAAAKGQP